MRADFSPHFEVFEKVRAYFSPQFEDLKSDAQHEFALFKGCREQKKGFVNKP